VIPPGWRRQDPRLTVVDGALALIAVLLVVQMWLLTATLEAWLGGNASVALPAAGVSTILFAGTVALASVVGRAH
jgi:Family of unknown function (DUF6755)